MPQVAQPFGLEVLEHLGLDARDQRDVGLALQRGGGASVHRTAVLPDRQRAYGGVTWRESMIAAICSFVFPWPKTTCDAMCAQL